ncbi:hypothetical protein Mapa_000493 [Marchantia paleacea]|nr:hypothetical protein Mapa_000493 [Marchantia paleacea]
MFVGHLGELELSSAALGNSLCSVTGFTVMLGLASGLETLCGQAFGAKQFNLLGVYYQTSLFVLLCCCIPISVLWWNMEPLLLLIGQEAQISKHTTVYMRTMIPFLWASAFIQTTIKYLQSQSVVVPIMIFSVSTFVVHIPLVYLLIYTLNVGYLGGALAISISYWMMLLQLLVYVAYSESRRAEKTWTGFIPPRLDVIVLFLKLAIPSAFMIILQFWAFELLVLMSGLMPNPRMEVSLLSICLNTAGIEFSFPFGLSAASSTRVSNELGAGNARGAKLASKVVMGISLLQATVVASAMLICETSGALHSAARLKSSRPCLRSCPFWRSVLSWMEFKAFLEVSILRGCGLQNPATVINIFSFYCVGIPSAVFFGFYYKWGAMGLYGGCICGSITQLVLIIILVAIIDWDKQVNLAQSRVGETAKVPVEKGRVEEIYEPLLTA